MKKLLCVLLLIGGSAALAPSSFALSYLFQVNLSGSEEVAPGDPDGSGTGTILINAVTKIISWDFDIQDIDLPFTGAHIHKAPAGVNGGVVVNFMASPSGFTFSNEADDILADPDGYYVNFHNATYPGGAIRGQLSEPSAVPETLGATWGALSLGILLVAGRRFKRNR